jgi:Zn-dependent protease with chaperone function
MMTGIRLARAALLTLFAAAAFGAEPVQVPPAPAEALAYHRGEDWFWLADQALAFLVPLVILFTGWSARLTAWARRVTGGRWYPTLGLYTILYLLITFVVGLPLSYAHDYVFAHAYDQSNQTLTKWGSDQIIALLVNLVAAILVVWIPFLLIRRLPKSWWAWSTIALTPVFIVGIVITPIWISPLFNKFAPLPPSELKTAIQAEAARGGLQNATILVMDQSADSKTFGAYVAGLGGTERIVLYDTTLKTLTQPEILFVVGHEMKHYLLGDIWKAVGLYAVVMLVGFFAVDRLARAATRQWASRFGFNDIADPAALPLLLVVFGIVSLVLTPGINAVTRHVEHEADRFGLEITHDNQAAASAFVKRFNEAMGIPYPGWLERNFRLDHPSLGDRITFANQYHPWEEGKPSVYGEWMKN